MVKTGCPSSCRPDDSDGAILLKVLGIKQVTALQAVLGGKRIWIPKAGGNFRCSVCSLRNDCIRTMHGKGIPVADISLRMCVSPKTIYRILRSKPAAKGLRPPRRPR